MTGIHCKSDTHVDSIVAAAGAKIEPFGEYVATYVAHLGCQNDGGYNEAGVVIHRTSGNDQGMHLLPSAAKVLPGRMRSAAMHAGSDGDTSITHTDGGAVEVWRSFSAGDTFRLADLIETEAGRLP